MREIVYTQYVIDRILSLDGDTRHKSVFLFGPRQTGKTTYLRATYPKSPFYSLLQADVFLRLSANPAALRQELALQPAAMPVVIDEIQKLPALLDEIHSMIEEQGRTFVMSGSSPIKLRRGGYNLLGGRARVKRLFPFVSAELPDWSLERAARFGTLPPIHQSSEPVQDLRDYAGTYLQMEVQAEGLVRGIQPFSRFLTIAALTSGEQVNFERVASDAAVPARTVREYYRLLDETYLGEMLPVFRMTHSKRKSTAHGKFYFFDVGVANVLAGRTNVDPGSDAFGRCLDGLVFSELRAWSHYFGDGRELSFWRTADGTEVDFVVADELAIEVKATARANARDLRGLRRIGDEHRFRHRILVCREETPRLVDDILVLSTREFLRRLWAGELLS